MAGRDAATMPTLASAMAQLSSGTTSQVMSTNAWPAFGSSKGMSSIVLPMAAINTLQRLSAGNRAGFVVMGSGVCLQPATGGEQEEAPDLVAPGYAQRKYDRDGEDDDSHVDEDVDKAQDEQRRRRRGRFFAPAGGVEVPLRLYGLAVHCRDEDVDH